MKRYLSFCQCLGFLSVWFCIASSLLPFKVQAESSEEECSAFDYSARLGSVQDQGESQWCSFFTAADQIGYLLRLEAEQKVSVVDVAYNYFLTSEEELQSLQTPHSFPPYNTTSAMKKARGQDKMLRPSADWVFKKNALPGKVAAFYNARGGACLERDFPSQSHLDVRRNNMSFFIAYYETRAREKEKLKWSSVGQVPRDLGVLTAQESLVHRDMWKKIKDAEELLYRPVHNSLRAEVEKHCVNRIPFEGFIASWVEWDKTQFIPTIHSQLKSGNIVSIVYDAHLIMKTPIVSAYVVGDPRQSPWLDKKVPKIEPYLHASTVVGQRWNDREKQCEFKIRNSWNKTCVTYKEDYSCENGHIWVPEKDLQPRLLEVGWLSLWKAP